MKRILARRALLPTGWAEDVLLGIRDGEIVEVSAAVPSPPPVDMTAGIVIPGLTNAHSHAFQRALAGRTEHRSRAERDSFWTWRERMYELTGRLDAGSLTAIARQAYTEMLASGYTSVVEFHYLFRDGAGGDGDAMFEALRRAARDSGIRLIYVPVLYERAGFDRSAPEPRQRRFAMDVESFLAHQARAAGAASGPVTVGIGAHSLRAVSEASLRRVVGRAIATGIPMHLHIAEQRRELVDCLTVHGERPVRWLLDRFGVDERWCLVHATHVNVDEIHGLAASGAVVCLCPSTEGNLGDGLFPLEMSSCAPGPDRDRLRQPGDDQPLRGAALARVRPATRLGIPERGFPRGSARGTGALPARARGRRAGRWATPFRAGSRGARGPRGAGRARTRCSPATARTPCSTRCYSRDIEYRSNESWSTANGRW